MNSTSKPEFGSHSGSSSLLNVVLMLLIFSLGVVLGMIAIASLFPNFSVSPSSLPSTPALAFYGLPPSPPALTPTPSPSSPPPAPCAEAPLSSSSAPSPSSAPAMGLMGFLAPSFVMHNMTDEELRWRASMAPKFPYTPYQRVPKVAFMFLVQDDMPLRPLWEKFFAGHQGFYSIYVHVGSSYADSPSTDSVFYGRMIQSQPTCWGCPRLVAAERRLLANALLDLSNERFVLLSQTCIPIFDFQTVYDYLTGSNGSFVDSFSIPARYNPSFFGRHNITLEQWRKGSQFFEMDRALAIEVVSDEVYFPLFLENCRGPTGVCLIDEHYIPTMVNLLGWRRNTNRSVTYTDWRRRGSHPRRHGARDVTEELFKTMRAGLLGNCTYNGKFTKICFMFARKFAPDALSPLLKLAPKVMGLA